MTGIMANIPFLQKHFQFAEKQLPNPFDFTYNSQNKTEAILKQITDQLRRRTFMDPICKPHVKWSMGLTMYIHCVVGIFPVGIRIMEIQHSPKLPVKPNVARNLSNKIYSRLSISICPPTDMS